MDSGRSDKATGIVAHISAPILSPYYPWRRTIAQPMAHTCVSPCPGESIAFFSMNGAGSKLPATSREKHTTFYSAPRNYQIDPRCLFPRVTETWQITILTPRVSIAAVCSKRFI